MLERDSGTTTRSSSFACADIILLALNFISSLVLLIHLLFYCERCKAELLLLYTIGRITYGYHAGVLVLLLKQIHVEAIGINDVGTTYRAS